MATVFDTIIECYKNCNQLLMIILIIILLAIIISSTFDTIPYEQFDNIDNNSNADKNINNGNNLNFDDVVETHVINLANRPEKRKYMETQLIKHNIKYNVFNAINGNQLNLKDLQNRKIIDENKAQIYMKRRMRRGEFGCALSHILIWIKLLQNTSPTTKYFLILEDDAYLVNNFKKKLTTLINDINKSDWDVLYLNENCYNWFGASCNGEDFSDKTIQPKRIGYGLYGYIINRSFVKKCLNELFPIYCAIDVFIDDGSLSKKFTCIRSKEILVHYNKKFASDTQLIL